MLTDCVTFLLILTPVFLGLLLGWGMSRGVFFLQERAHQDRAERYQRLYRDALRKIRTLEETLEQERERVCLQDPEDFPPLATFFSLQDRAEGPLS